MCMPSDAGPGLSMRVMDSRGNDGFCRKPRLAPQIIVLSFICICKPGCMWGEGNSLFGRYCSLSSSVRRVIHLVSHGRDGLKSDIKGIPHLLPVYIHVFIYGMVREDGDSRMHGTSWSGSGVAASVFFFKVPQASAALSPSQWGR